MRFSQAEKMEIIRLAEGSRLGVKQTTRHLPITLTLSRGQRDRGAETTAPYSYLIIFTQSYPSDRRTISFRRLIVSAYIPLI